MQSTFIFKIKKINMSKIINTSSKEKKSSIARLKNFVVSSNIEARMNELEK